MNPNSFKQGFLQTKLLFWISNYYYLDHSNFFKFENEYTHSPSEVISLDQAKVSGPEKIDDLFYFTLHQQDYETMFRAVSLQDAQEWVQQINFALKGPQTLITHQTLQSLQDEEHQDLIRLENMNLDWKQHKIYDKLRLSYAETKQTQLIKGEWDINQSIKLLKRVFKDEENTSLFQPFMKSNKHIGQNQYEQCFQIQIGNKLHNKKRVLVQMSFKRKSNIKSNYIFIYRQVQNSQLFEINLQLLEDNQLKQKSQGQMIVSFKKSKDKVIHKFAKEYIINHQILNYEWDHIINRLQSLTEAPKNIQNTQPIVGEGLEIYFLPKDRLGYVDQSQDKSHPAFAFEEKHLRFTCLSDQEKEILNQFRTRMKKIALNDNALIRHLQARQFDLDAAEKMLTDILEWRKQNNINSLDSNSQKYDYFRNKNILIMLGEGKLGHPIFYIRAENLLPDQYKDPNPTIEVFIEYFCSLMEYNIRNMRGHIDCQILIIDCFNLSRKNVSLDLIKAVMAYVFMKYPERQIRNIIINTDWLAKSIYNIVKKFLPKRTIDKMAFAGQDVKEIQEVLLRDIDIKIIPKKYGGFNDLLI